MYFSNEFLYDFKPVYEGILAAKSVKPECAIVEVIDEEPDGAGMFEPAGTLDVLEQIGDELNALTIYTDRPAYFMSLQRQCMRRPDWFHLSYRKSVLD